MAIGRHYQNAYVTRDIAKAVESFRTHTDPRLVAEVEVETEVWTPRGEGKGTQKLAFIWLEDFNYELIQPVSGDVLKIYSDALPEGDEMVFHHVCHRVDDWDEALTKIEALPFEMVLRGGTPGALEFCYIDTRPWLGHYTEYIWANEERWGQLGGR